MAFSAPFFKEWVTFSFASYLPWCLEEIENLACFPLCLPITLLSYFRNPIFFKADVPIGWLFIGLSHWTPHCRASRVAFYPNSCHVSGWLHKLPEWSSQSPSLPKLLSLVSPFTHAHPLIPHESCHPQTNHITTRPPAFIFSDQPPYVLNWTPHKKLCHRLIYHSEIFEMVP